VYGPESFKKATYSFIYFGLPKTVSVMTWEWQEIDSKDKRNKICFIFSLLKKTQERL
jgi:hypothetical protein